MASLAAQSRMLMQTEHSTNAMLIHITDTVSQGKKGSTLTYMFTMMMSRERCWPPTAEPPLRRKT